jgi:hypothetical protein
MIITGNNALTNKRDEDPRNETFTLNLLLVNVIAVGFYIYQQTTLLHLPTAMIWNSDNPYIYSILLVWR